MSEETKGSFKTAAAAFGGLLAAAAVLAYVTASKSPASVSSPFLGFAAPTPTSSLTMPKAARLSPEPAATRSISAAAAVLAASPMPFAAREIVTEDSAPGGEETAAPALAAASFGGAALTSHEGSADGNAPTAPKAKAAGSKPVVSGKASSRRSPAVAARVHYGANSRAQLMGRAAGPVYNFKGQNAEAAGPEALALGLQKLAQAQKAADSDPAVADADKAKLDAGVSTVRATLDPVVKP
jgi:hypothetical protein